MDNQPPGGRDAKTQFHTTRWSLIADATTSDTREATAAMQELCSRYWYPLYAFVRRRGYSPFDAEDLTQAFFTRILEHDLVHAADRTRGRFRSFLLTSLENFLINERQRGTAQKRGAGKRMLSINVDDAEQRYLAEPVDIDTPARLFDRRWALTTLERALHAVGEHYRAVGHSQTYEALKEFLTGDDRQVDSYEHACKQLEITPDAARSAVYRLRARYRQELRAVIAETLSSPDEIDEEIDQLFRALEG